MATIEERATTITVEIIVNTVQVIEHRDAETLKGIKGYIIRELKKQRQIDIDKACEWIYERRDWYVETEDNGISGKLSDDFFAEFRKAMEEE